MNLQQELHRSLIDAYRRAGKEVGYWGNYFLRAVKKNGGLVTVKKMLLPTTTGKIQKGLQALIDAGRPDLSIEAIVLQPRFAGLFTQNELTEAKNRLSVFPQSAFRQPVTPAKNFPETMSEDRKYSEGAVRRITVNAFERDSKARAVCLKKHGCYCRVCGMNFESNYGRLGKGFIHVHHKKPLAATRREYIIDPIKDLIPVCPNCHAMLHTSEPPLSIDELKRYIKKKNR